MHFNLTVDFVHALIMWAVGFFMGTCVVGRIRKAWRQHLHNQEVMMDRLDTSTPGGLNDLLKEEEERE